MASPTPPEADNHLLTPVDPPATPLHLHLLYELGARAGLVETGETPAPDSPQDTLDTALGTWRETLTKALSEGALQPTPKLLSELLALREERLFITALKAGGDGSALAPEGVPLLQKAAESGLYAGTWQVVHGGAQRPDSRVLGTALNGAIEQGCPGTARLLLDAGAQPLQRHLDQALRHGSHATFSALLEAGRGWPRPGGRAERDRAIQVLAHQNPGFTRALLAHGPRLSHWTTLAEGASFTVLYEALNSKLAGAENIRLLLDQVIESDQDINAVQSTSEDTLLHLCLMAKDKVSGQTLEALLAKPDLNVSARNVAGETPIVTALQHGHGREVLEKLLKAGARLEDCFKAPKDGDIFPLCFLRSAPNHNDVEWLFERGLDTGVLNADMINTPGKGPYSSLLFWCVTHQYPIARRLLDVPGVDPNKTAGITGSGSVLAEAIWKQERELIKPLLAIGADPNVCRDGWWPSPLSLVVKRGWLDEINALLDAGAHVDGEALKEAINEIGVRNSDQDRVHRIQILERLLETHPTIDRDVLSHAVETLNEDLTYKLGIARSLTLLLEACDNADALNAACANTLRSVQYDPATKVMLPFVAPDAELFRSMGAHDLQEGTSAPLDTPAMRRLVALGIDPAALLGYVEALYGPASQQAKGRIKHHARGRMLDLLLRTHGAHPPQGMVQALAKAGAPGPDLALVAHAAPDQLNVPDEDGCLPLTNLLANTARVTTTQVKALVEAGATLPDEIEELAAGHSASLADYLAGKAKAVRPNDQHRASALA